jgi:hypothetical protein
VSIATFHNYIEPNKGVRLVGERKFLSVCEVHDLKEFRLEFGRAGVSKIVQSKS